jgi:hypothetical protein
MPLPVSVKELHLSELLQLRPLSVDPDGWPRGGLMMYRWSAKRAPHTLMSGIVVALLLVGVVNVLPAGAVGPFPDYTPPRTHNLTGCPRVAIEGFRGSGEAFDDGTLGLGGAIKPLYDALRNRLGAANVGSSAASYPAVPWAIGLNRLDLWLAAMNNAFRNVVRNEYPDSVATGGNDGASDITHLAVRCPNTKIVVVGYSQGAEVARRVLARLNPSAGGHVAAAVLMGDPTFRAGEAGIVRVGGTANGRGISWALHPSTITAIQPRYAGRVITDCHDNDLVCRGADASSLNGHFRYHLDATVLADFVLGRISPAQAGRDCVAFVADVTVPDGTRFSAGASFTKAWRLRNCGTTNWSGLNAVRVAGSFGPGAFSVPRVAPGASTDIRVPMVAPGTAGHYRSTYRLRATSGQYAANSFWVDINVVGGLGHDCEAFVADVTVPDGTVVSTGASFTKVWRLRNCGTTDWSGLSAVRVDGRFGPGSFLVPRVAPGRTGDLSAGMVAPSTPGRYRSTYRLRAADGHYAANSFWVDINVTAPTAPNRYAVSSYDRMTPGAPYHGYFTSAWQNFVARSNRITYLGVTVGNPRLPAGQPVAANVTIRLCTNPSCSGVLAQRSPQIVNYGNSAVDIGDVPVTPGATYYVVWYQPAAAAGSTWVTYWWAGGPGITQSDQMQAVVRGFNA